MHDKLYIAYAYFACGSFGVVGVGESPGECVKKIAEHKESALTISDDLRYEVIRYGAPLIPKNLLNRGVCKKEKIGAVIVERDTDNPILSSGAMIWEQKASEDLKVTRGRAEKLKAGGRYGRVWLGEIDVNQLEEIV